MRKKVKKVLSIAVLMTLVAILAAGCAKQEKKEKTTDSVKKETVEKEDKKEEKKEIPFEKGVRTESTYENKWMNVKFAVPENYVIAKDEEMQQMFNAGADAVDMTEAQKAAMEKINYEMVAVNAVEGVNVNVLVEKLPLSSITEEQYIEASQKAASQNTGDLNFQPSGTYTDKELAGQGFKMSTMTVETQGIKMNQELYVKKIGSYMVVITVTFPEGADAAKDNLLNAFQPRA